VFQLDFELSLQVKNAHGASPETAGATELRYDLFLGNVILRNDSCNLDAVWGWIPLLDFASGIEKICTDLTSQSLNEAKFTFTENDETLNFERVESDIVMSASYSSCEIVVPQAEFATKVRSFISRLRGVVEGDCPEIVRNASYRALFVSFDIKADENF